MNIRGPASRTASSAEGRRAADPTELAVGLPVMEVGEDRLR